MPNTFLVAFFKYFDMTQPMWLCKN